MKSTDLIGFAIAAVVLLVEYWGTRKIVVPNRFTKFLLAIMIPIVVLIVAVILQPKYFILGIVGIICLFSVPILLTVSVRNKVIHLGDTLSFSGKSYGSVGYQYYLEFDNTAFKMETQVKDLYKPREEDFVIDRRTGERKFIRPAGGDECAITYTLTATKKGVYQIREIAAFRGDIESEKIHRIKVK